MRIDKISNNFCKIDENLPNARGLALRENCQYSEFFWSVLSANAGKYEFLLENTKLNFYKILPCFYKEPDPT